MVWNRAIFSKVVKEERPAHRDPDKRPPAVLPHDHVAQHLPESTPSRDGGDIQAFSAGSKAIDGKRLVG